MLVKRIAACTNLTFNRFPVIQPVSSKVHHFLHILASPRYAPGIFAVNVTWMKRGFDAGQMHRSIYPSIFNRLRAKARYWSEISTFPYPPCMQCPHWGVPFGIPGKIWSTEN